MALLNWSPTYETGNDAVDHEHRELIALLNALHDNLDKNAPQDDTQAFLGEVFAKISAHFALEESMMRRSAYDEYEDHKEDHENLLDEIRDIMEAYNAGAYTDLDRELADTLGTWFGQHFATRDARLHGKLGLF